MSYETNVGINEPRGPARGDPAYGGARVTRDGVNGVDFVIFVGAAVMVWGPLAAGAFLH